VLTNRVLDFAENSVGYYLPEEQEIQEEHTEGFAIICLPLPTSTFTRLTSTAFTFLRTWARSRALSHKAYHRAQRKAYHQVEQAKLYSESVITKYPLAVNAVNFVKTRDPEIKQNIVQQLTTTVSVRSPLIGERMKPNSTDLSITPRRQKVSLQRTPLLSGLPPMLSL